MCREGHVADVGVIQDLHLDPPGEGWKLLNEGDLLVPLRGVGVALHGRLSLGPTNTRAQV